MIYISAQPDQFYFLWQLKLQLFNFNLLGIPKEEIHVLIGYNPIIGLNIFFKEFISTNNQACFFIYEDTRPHKAYPSSIRPHLLKKHLKKYPKLEKECFFYHDSDIIFRKHPHLLILEKDPIWYASDTRNYLDYNYIIKNSNYDIFVGMCKIVGISPKYVIENSNTAGGAQYILKETTYSFWDKVESDCERMFSFLKSKSTKKGIFNENNKKLFSLDFWVTDMWVLWWNAILIGRKFNISLDLNFCWITSPIEKWHSCNILHYTGFKNPMDNHFFIKTKYKFSEPFYDNFQLIDNSSCSKILVNIINDYKNNVIYKKRVYIKNFAIVILIKNQSLSDINTLIQYIEKHIEIEIILLTTSPYIEIKLQKLNKKIINGYKQSNLEETLKYLNCLYAIILEPNVLPLQETLLKIINFTKHKNYHKLQCYGEARKIDILSKYIFSKILDSQYLISNKNKMLITSEYINIGITVYSLLSPNMQNIKYECNCFIF